MCFRYYFIYIKLFFILLPVISAQINPLPNQINKKVNILFVVVDDLRHLAENIVNLPNFEKLAGRSIYFQNAFAQVSLCIYLNTYLIEQREFNEWTGFSYS